MRLSRPARLAAAVGVVALLVGCNGGEPLAPVIRIEDIITAVATSDGSVQGVLRSGLAPEAGSAAAPTVTGISAVVNGGSAGVTVTGAASYTRMIVSVAGTSGWYELLLPAGVGAEDLVVSVAPGVNGRALGLRYAVGAGASDVSQYAEQALRLIQVGTGDVQVSVAWVGATDVDLHVFDPSGEEVYFANRIAASGGQLDLDSNAACAIDDVNNENIVWPTGQAPRGEYVVVLDYWSECSQPRSDWVVTVQVRGQAPRVFSGSFVGDNAGFRDVEIARFTY